MKLLRPGRATRGLGALVLSLALLGIAAPGRAGGDYVAGEPGLGDPFFPLAGNGGYQVAHYSLDLDYDPATRHLDAEVTIRATATQNLWRFDLDLRGFDVSRVLVDDRAASFSREGQELVITPRKGLRAGRAFTVVVRYAGMPTVVTDPDGSIEGWVPTPDGAYVVGEPQGSPAWYPVNDSPADKATFDISVTVPDGLTVMSNGVLVDRIPRGGRTTFVWRERSPMAPYLATATLGRFKLTRYRLERGTPVYVAVDPALPPSPALANLPEMVDFFSSLYGRYPFEAAGAVVDDAPEVGYALETQTKPVFDRPPDEALLAHELAHMWFGDSVTLRRWPDIWLHAGFATWSEWMWSEHQGRESAHQTFETLAGTPATDTAFWTPPPGNLGSAAELFDETVYDRGAMTLQALREKVGDARFFRILRHWAARHRYGNVATPQFVELAERDSGMDLDHFFDVWLQQPHKPTSW